MYYTDIHAYTYTYTSTRKTHIRTRSLCFVKKEEEGKKEKKKKREKKQDIIRDSRWMGHNEITYPIADATINREDSIFAGL